MKVTSREEVTQAADGTVVRWPRDDRKVGSSLILYSIYLI